MLCGLARTRQVGAPTATATTASSSACSTAQGSGASGSAAAPQAEVNTPVAAAAAESATEASRAAEPDAPAQDSGARNTADAGVDEQDGSDDGRPDEHDDLEDLPISDLSLCKDVPRGGNKVNRSFKSMRGTINGYIWMCAEPRWFAKMNLGTLHSLQRRFLPLQPKVQEEASVELQIAYRQLAFRLCGLLAAFKAFKHFSDSQNVRSLDKAVRPMQELFRVLKAFSRHTCPNR